MTIVLGAYATEAEAEEAKAIRPEPQEELSVSSNGNDESHPFIIVWARPS